ncbi:MAG: RnfABCDGE type electron transport complex subunit D, partial [Treponema sp.]|nr:RnfABCDGE type electron transport complex subunit D [Treponema sp.]
MPELFLGSSPHIASPVKTRTIMGRVVAALVPAAVFGVVLYGLHALWLIAVSVAAAVGGEALFRRIIRRPGRSGDLSAV